MKLKVLTKIRTIAYLAITLVLALKLGLLLSWGAFFVWGLLMALWEQPTDHWATSIIAKLGGKQSFWDNTESWKYKLKLLGMDFPWHDSFHISKGLSILLVCFVPLLPGSHPWYVCLALGWVTTESFNLFYNYVLTTRQP